MTSTRYRLPNALGGGECTIKDRDQRYGPDRYVRATVGEGDEAITVDLLRGLLTEVELPLPDEPPFGALVATGTDDNPLPIWRHWMDTGWNVVGGRPDADRSWADVCLDSMQRAGRPPVRLVPDPFAEPVELPWSGMDKYSHQHVQVRTSAADWQDGDSGPPRLTAAWVTAGNSNQGSHITADLARQMARALWTAADAAEKEQS